MKKSVLVQVRRRVATVELRLKENVLDTAAARELCDAAESIAHDDRVAVVVIRSAGKSFCRGGAYAAGTPNWALALRKLEPPIIAALHGDVADEGAELALLADIRIASRNTRFSFGQVGAGRLPRFGGTQTLALQVGRMRALEMILSGRSILAAEAERVGLVSSRVAPRELEARVREQAEELAKRGPVALRYAKEAILNGSAMTLRQGIRLEQDLYVLLQTTDDRNEGIASFIERRIPSFDGR